MVERVAGPQGVPRQKGEPVTFLAAGGLRNTARRGIPGVSVRVRLPSYRSLPLSCIREIRLSIDGNEVDADEIELVLDGHGYTVFELSDRADLWWYVLDSAELFVPSKTPLALGSHTVEGSITTLIPYATAGRTTVTTRSRVELTIDPED